MSSSFTTEAFSLLGVGIFVIALRTAARLAMVGPRGLKFDDYLMLVAAVIYSLETATAYVVGAWWLGLGNNGMTDEERRTLDPASLEAHIRRGGSKTQLVGWSTYTLLLWTLKLCLTIFYSRLTSGLSHLQNRVRIAYVLIGVTYIATELSVLLGCRPFKKNWQIYPDPGKFCQPAISPIDCYVTLILNVTTDMYLMSIPIPMLLHANLTRKRKASLLVVFGGGILVMACGILRCALIISNPVGGAQAAGSWACRETFIAVVVGNLPLIYPMASHHLEKLANSSLLSRYNLAGSGRSSHKTPDYPLRPTIGSERARERGGRKGVRSLNALPSTWLPSTYHEDGSEEMMVGSKGTCIAQTITEEGSMKEGITVTKETDVSIGNGRDPGMNV